MERLKVAYICHVCNPIIRSHVPLKKRRIINLINRMLGRPISSLRDYSVYHTLLFENAALLSGIELHAVIPYDRLACPYIHFIDNGVHYHVFQDQRGCLYHRIFDRYRNIKSRYERNTRSIIKIIDRIRPDVINMIGAEGPFFNSAALAIDTNRYPLILTLQTALSDPDFLANYPMDPKSYSECREIEQMLFRHCHYIAHDSRWYRAIAKKYNPDAIFVRYSFLMTTHNIDMNVKKEFDFVYFSADISKAGMDAVEAFGRAFKKNKNITLNMVGYYSEDTYQKFINKLEKFGCVDNVTFSGYFPSHNDALKQVVKSRYALVPIKIDLISGTITESIKLGLPVVTFRTKGTPQMNNRGIAVLLSDIGDYDNMALNILMLMEDTVLAETMRCNAKRFISNIWDNRTAVIRLGKVYHAIYENFHNGTTIPHDLTEAVY